MESHFPVIKEDFELLKGDRASCLSMPCQVVITERIARKYFRDEDPVGKILIFNRIWGRCLVR